MAASRAATSSVVCDDCEDLVFGVFCSCWLACSTPAWTSAITDGSSAMACRMSSAALSTASSSARACPRADSAARNESTNPACCPAVADWPATSRAEPMLRSAKDSRSLAVATLPETEVSAAASNSLCRSASRCSVGATWVVSSTYCCVSPSSRDGALITKLRSCSNASVCESNSRSALAAVTITWVSSWRRCSGGRVVSSSSC